MVCLRQTEQRIHDRGVAVRAGDRDVLGARAAQGRGAVVAQGQGRGVGGPGEHGRAGTGLVRGDELGLVTLLFVHALEVEDGGQRGDAVLDAGGAVIPQNRREGVGHGGDAGPQTVVGVDDHLGAGLGEFGGRDGVVGRRHHDHRGRQRPLREEFQDRLRRGSLGVDQHGVGARSGVGLPAGERLVQAPARDQCLDPGDDHQVGVALRALGRGELAAELTHGGEFLPARDEAVDLREPFVLDRHGGDAGCFVAADHVHHVVRVAVAGVTVGHDRDVDRGGQ